MFKLGDIFRSKLDDIKIIKVIGHYKNTVIITEDLKSYSENEFLQFIKSHKYKFLTNIEQNEEEQGQSIAKYSVGDRFDSKYFTEFEVILIFKYNHQDIIVTYNKKGIYSARTIEKLDKYLEDGNFNLVLGQVTMGTAI